MNMADYQLDMDLIRSMATNQSQQLTQSNGIFEEKDMFLKDGNLQDVDFMDEAYALNFKPPQGPQTSTPTYHATQQSNDYVDQDDILTPLISPAITPSFSYHHKLHNGTIGSDTDFSPLTSPAMIPQQENYRYQYQSSNQVHQQPVHQHPHLHLQRQGYPTTSTSAPSSSLHLISADEINDQYDELEKTKRMITRRLSELEKRQMTPASVSNRHQQIPRNPTTYMSEYSNTSMATYSNNLQQQQTRLEPVTPASLMNMRQQERQSITNTMHIKKTHQLPLNNNGYITTSSPIATSYKQIKRKQSSLDLKANRKSRRSSTLPTDKHHPLTPHNTYRSHVSPRALKPLLISPGLKPDNNQAPPLPLLDSDAEHILATRSNYQNLMEGKAAALGIGFTQHIKSGIEVRRTAHKAAEQKRRDSLKEWFDRLRLEVEEGYVKKRSGLKSKVIREQQREGGHSSKRQRSDEEEEEEEEEGDDDDEEDPLKPLSKVLLLRYAYEYITHLKDTLDERDESIRLMTNGVQQQQQQPGGMGDVDGGE